MEPTPVMVKKYGNRRLYDTQSSRYITLDDLSQMIQGGQDVKVVDAKSGADLTKGVLLQIISEQEKDRDMLPVSFLKNVIKYSDAAVREPLHRYLSFSLDAFLQAQHQFEQQYRQVAGGMLNPMAWMMGNMPGSQPGAPGPMPQPPQAAPYPPASEEPPFAPEPPSPVAPPAAQAAPEPAESNTEDQLELLKAQMAQMQQMMAQLVDKK